MRSIGQTGLSPHEQSMAAIRREAEHYDKAQLSLPRSTPLAFHAVASLLF